MFVFWPLRFIAVAALLTANSANPAIAEKQILSEKHSISVRGIIGHDVIFNYRKEKKAMVDDDKAVSNSDDILGGVGLPPKGWVSGTITEIMESWPLQIRVFTNGEDLIVELATDAVLESNIGTLPPSDLSLGDQVEILIESDPTRSGAFHVVHIKRH